MLLQHKRTNEYGKMYILTSLETYMTFNLYKQYLDTECPDIINTLDLHQKMATEISTKTFMYDKIFGKTCIHKVRNHTRIFTPFGTYYLNNGEIYELNNKTPVKSIPTPHYTVEFERHTYRRHPHSPLELSIDITHGDYNVARQLLSGVSFSTIRENGEKREKHTQSKSQLYILDYSFETQDTEIDINREIDYFIITNKKLS